MALITYSSEDKNVPITITLSITELEVIPQISGSYFSNKSYWKAIAIELINPTNNQKINIAFDYNGETTSISDIFTIPSELDGDDLQINRIVIVDKENGFLSLVRSQIPSASAYDIDGVVPTGTAFSLSLKDANVALSNSNYTATNNNAQTSALHTNYMDNAGYIIANGGKYYLELTMGAMPNNVYYGGNVNGIGLIRMSSTPTVFSAGVVFAGGDGSMYVAANSPSIVRNGSIIGGFPSYTVGDVIGIAVDLDAQTVKFVKNGVWYSAASGGNANFNLVNGDGLPAGGTKIFLGAITNYGGGVVTVNSTQLYLPAGYTQV